MKMKMKVSKRNHSNTPSIAAWLLRSVMGIVVVACCCCSTVLLVAADDEATSSTTATYDPPIQFTQYEGGCDGEDSKTVGSGTVVSLTNLSWGRFCTTKLDADDQPAYWKFDIDCFKYRGTVVHYYKCTDDSCDECSDEVGESHDAKAWDPWLVDDPGNHCYHATFGNYSVYYQYDSSTEGTDMRDKMIATSCVSSWLPFLPVEEDNDPATMPEGAISCGGEDSYCDCGRDCVAYAESWCACADALTCCEDNNSYEVYDADNNGVPDSFIQCADSFTVCDCSNDCTFNRDQCQCADAQACCAPHVNCPDSPPNDHCNCASDCENNPQFCTCDEAQTCCAEYVPSIGQLQTGEEEAIGNDSNNDFPIVASPPQETGSDATDVADENSEVVIVVNEGSSSSSSSSETNEASYGFKCNTIHDLICGEDIFSRLCTLMSDTVPGLFEELNSGVYTIFAPQDSSFDAIDDLLDGASPEELERIFKFHVHEGGIVWPWNLECTEKILMASGDNSRTQCEKNQETGTVDKYQKGSGNKKLGLLPKIELPSLRACNGIVHVIDMVMLPVGGKSADMIIEAEEEDAAGDDDDDDDDDDSSVIVTEVLPEEDENSIANADLSKSNASFDPMACIQGAVDGEACGHCIPEGSPNFEANGTRYTGNPGNQVEIKYNCVCDVSQPTWACTDTITATPAPAPPAGDSPADLTTNCKGDNPNPKTGDSCESFLNVGEISFSCMWGAPTPVGTPLQNQNCTCTSATNVYDCATVQIGNADLSKSNTVSDLMPAPAPTWVPWDQVQPSSSMPNTSSPNSPAGTSMKCNNTPGFPGDGSSCAGVIPDGLPSYGCAFAAQMMDVNGVVTTESASCTCSATDERWSCIGSITPATDADTAVLPEGESSSISKDDCNNTPSFPGDGSSCAGVVPDGWPQITCGFGQTVTINGVATSESASCTCLKTDETWSCTGYITPSTVVNNAV